jgi:preprotein translocase subunit SecB
MARSSKKIKNTEAFEAKNPVQRAKPVAPMPLALERVALRELSYREIPGMTATPVPGELVQMNIALKINAQVMLLPEGCELRLNAEVVPDPTYQPIEMQVTVSGYFRRVSEIRDEELLEFLRGPGVRIVFPYLRELVSSTTGRGIFPAVWIDPIGLGMTAGPVTAQPAP